MALLDLDLPPLVRLYPVADGRNAWVALGIDLTMGNLAQLVPALFSSPDLLAAGAPLDYVLLLASPVGLTPNLLTLLPASRVWLVFAVAALAEEGSAQRLAALRDSGYRIMLDGALAPGQARPPGIGAVSLDCALGAPRPDSLSAMFGPHLARAVDTPARQAECARAGFTWFSGDYALASTVCSSEDSAARRRILRLLALLAADADSRELEMLLKQDPTLSYHLLKLVNSAAFAVNTTITSYAQAIAVLGRRQLQRWLQLLLYARASADGLPNLLLPLAALRAAQLEQLCLRDGGTRDAQDFAFMAGAFSLLDRLLGMPMDAVLADLALPDEVSAALLSRSGQLGARLALTGQVPDAPALARAGIDARAWWDSQLHAHQWAIKVASNV